MAKISTTIQHDYMRFQIAFGTRKLSGNVTRHDHTVKLTPFDGQMARAASSAIDYVMKEYVQKGLINPGQLFDVIRPAAEKADSVDAFVSGFKDLLEQKHGLVVRDFDIEPRPSTVATVAKDGRGYRAEIFFASGEKVSFKSSGKSVSIGMQPMITAFADEITQLAFAAISSGTGSEMLVRGMANTAESSGTPEDWIERLRAAVRPSFG